MSRFITLKIPNSSLPLNINFEGYKILFRNYKKQKDFTYFYAVSEKEEFYDETTNLILKTYFSHILKQKKPELYHINNNEYKHNNNILSISNHHTYGEDIPIFKPYVDKPRSNRYCPTLYEDNSSFYLSNRRKTLRWFNFFKKRKIINHIKQYNITLNQLYDTSTFIASDKDLVDIQEKIIVTELHPFFVSYRPRFFKANQEHDLFPDNFLKNDITDIYTSLQNTYSLILTKIEKKENISIQNKNFFFCNYVDISKFKYLSSMITIQDFCYLLSDFSKLNLDNNSRFIKIWKSAIFNTKTEDIEAEVFNENVFNKIYSELIYEDKLFDHQKFLIILENLISHNKTDAFNVILNNKYLKDYHSLIKIKIEQNTLSGIINANKVSNNKRL